MKIHFVDFSIWFFLSAFIYTIDNFRIKCEYLSFELVLAECCFVLFRIMTPKPSTTIGNATDYPDQQENSSSTTDRMIIKRKPLSSFGDHYRIGEEIGR